MTVTRRLAAILAADVAGYSRLMGADEEGTLNRLKAHRRELIDPKIAEHHGRIVKTTGDGMLLEFGSVLDAVRCAVEVQQRMTGRNAEVPQERRIEFRVGINLGDIIIDGDDIHGDGVNIAARLEGLSEPGGVFISHKVRQELGNKLDLAFDDLGEQNLKNIADPIRVHRVRLNGKAAYAPALALPDKPSIAVLPFTNMSGDPEQDYFADGIVEDITTALSRIKWFFVIARNSSFTYKGRAVDVKQVARELGVRYVLEGSLRKAGSRLRITSQLIEAATGNHVWAERYDREIADIFAVQDEITESVVASLEPRLYAAENIRIQGNPPESLDAWGCVIRALWHLGRMSKDDSEQAKQLLVRAIDLSPRYAKAHALLAWAEADAVLRGVSSAGAGLPVARQHARTALALDDDDPWTFCAAGFIETLASRYEDAIAAFRRAIDLNPNFAIAHGWMGTALSLGGNPDDAVKAIDRAMRMSPRDSFNALLLHSAGVAHFAAERYAEGIACERKALRERPNFAAPRRFLAACLVNLGELEEAHAVIAELLLVQPNSSIKGDAYGYGVFAQSSVQERYVEALRKAGLPEE